MYGLVEASQSKKKIHWKKVFLVFNKITQMINTYQ